MLHYQDHSFRIMQLTDIHIGSFPFVTEDLQTLAAIKKAVLAVKPDLIMVTGDLIWSDGVDRPERGYQALVELFNQLPFPIAVTYGNHDAEDTMTRTHLRQLEAGLKYRVPKQHAFVDDRDKESYTLEINDSHGLRHVLYVIDTGNHAPGSETAYDYPSTQQVAWWHQTQANYQAEKQTTTLDLAFIHIPLPEYQQAGEHQLAGYFWETNPRVSCGQLNAGLFSEFEHDNQLKAVFCGHDHDNNFVGTYLGKQLIYGNVSGYNCYGDLARGYRLINLRPNHFTTAIIPYED